MPPLGDGMSIQTGSGWPQSKCRGRIGPLGMSKQPGRGCCCRRFWACSCQPPAGHRARPCTLEANYSHCHCRARSCCRGSIARRRWRRWTNTQSPPGIRHAGPGYNWGGHRCCPCMSSGQGNGCCSHSEGGHSGPWFRHTSNRQGSGSPGCRQRGRMRLPGMSNRWGMGCPRCKRSAGICPAPPA